MSNTNSAWAAALEDHAPVADIDITVNDSGDNADDDYEEESFDVDYDEDGGMLEAVDADGDASYDGVATEMVEDEAEVEEAEAAAEKLEETVAQLESAAVAVESRIIHEDGMTSGELQFMMIGLEGRLKNSQSLFPSTEAMGHNRLGASNEAMASLKKGIAAVWEALKNAIATVISKLRQWFGTTLRGANKLQARANGVIGAAKRITTEPAQDKIKLNSVQAFVSGKNSIATNGSSATSTIASLSITLRNTLSTSATAGWADYIAQYSKVVEGLMASSSKESGEYDEAAAVAQVTAVKGWAEAGIAVRYSDEDNERFSGFNSTRSDVLPGGKSIYVMAGPSAGLPTTLDAFKAAQKYRGLVIEGAAGDTDAKTKETVFETLSPSDIIKIATTVSSITAVIAEYQLAWSRRDKVIDTVQKQIGNAVKKLDAKKGDYAGSAKQQEVVGVLLRSIGNELRDAPKADARVIQLALQSSSAYLGYCTRSMAQYKPKKEKPAAADKPADDNTSDDTTDK